MEERKDYAVLRFVDRNGWSYMVNDCVNGCSLMEYAKLGIQVEKQTAFEWIRQLVRQLEQYYRCGEENAAYGYMNPHAVIITKDNSLFLLDTGESENEELLRQMNKKKLRMLFVRKERILSQKTERSDDLYGLAKVMEFIAEKCLPPKVFSRREERIWKKMLGKCYSGGKNAIKVLKAVNKESVLLGQERETPKKQESGGKVLLAVLAIIVLSAVIIGEVIKKPEAKASAADQEIKEAELVKEEPEPAVDIQIQEESPYLEMGLLYYEAKEDYRNSLNSLEKGSKDSKLTEGYRKVIACLKNDGIWQEEEESAEETIKEIREELERTEDLIQGKEYLYHYPLLRLGFLLESTEGKKLAERIGEEMVSGQEWYRWEQNGEKEREIRKYLAESYLTLNEKLKAAEQYEKIKETESNEEELEDIYEKLKQIYEEEQDYEKVWELCKEATERLPDSESMWIDYLERYLENPEMERELCVEAVKKAIREMPAITESEEFKNFQEKYKVKLEDGNVRIEE